MAVSAGQSFVIPARKSLPEAKTASVFDITLNLSGLPPPVAGAPRFQLNARLTRDGVPGLPGGGGAGARARGMSEVARSSGLTREALYKALRASSHPQFDTILKVCGALGIRLVAEVAKPA